MLCSFCNKEIPVGNTKYEVIHAGERKQVCVFCYTHLEELLKAARKSQEGG